MFFSVHNTLFLIDPFYTFFSANFSFIMDNIDPTGETAKMPGICVTPLLSFMTFMGQTVFFYSLAVIIDYWDVNKFRHADGNKPRIE